MVCIRVQPQWAYFEIFGCLRYVGLTISGTSGLKTGILTIDTFDFPLVSLLLSRCTQSYNSCLLCGSLLVLQINQCVQEVCRKRLPCLFTSSKRDKMCEWPLNLQLAKACGLKDENITYYDLEENIVSGPPKGQILEQGSWCNLEGSSTCTWCAF